MEYKDYYKILDVDRNASEADIKKQYRRLARKYHPDVSKEADAESKFKEVQEAYAVLKDPEKRKAYDQLGANWQHGQGFEPPPGWEFHEGARGQQAHYDAGDFSDFFEQIFGGMGGMGGRRAHAGFREQAFKQRGQDQHAKIVVSLKEAFNGTTRELQLQQPVMQDNGQVILKNRQLRVKIPAGVTNGQQIRLKGQGGEGVGGAPNGDLYLEVTVADTQHFTLNGKDIYLHLPITPWEAALGATITVPTLSGSVQMKIPAHTQGGRKMRLKGKGMPGKTAGDQYVILNIAIPEAKTAEDKALFEKMAQAMPFNPRAHILAEV